mgnify:CR=1 FL=1
MSSLRSYWICQWNDDVQLMNSWNDVFTELETDKDMYIFSKKHMYKADMDNKNFTHQSYMAKPKIIERGTVKELQ